jgi:hypothetical protein
MADKALPVRHRRRFLIVGGDLDEACATIRVIGLHLDPARVTALLRVRPTKSHRRGDIVNPPYPARSSHGIWLLKSNHVKGHNLESAIWRLLRRLPSDFGRWTRALAGAKASMFCGLFLNAWNRHLNFSDKLLVELGRRKMKLQFDIFGDDGRIEYGPRSRRKRTTSLRRRLKG